MQVKSIAECSRGSILQYSRPSLSYHLSLRPICFCLFLSGHFTQVLLHVLLHSFICPLQIGYEAEELAKVGSKHMYTGSMSLDGVFLARAVCVNKKELKHLVFEKGLNVLMNKTVAEIYSLIDPGVQTLRWEQFSSTLTLNAPITIKVVCFSSAGMFKKPLWQTVWTQIRLLL